MKLASVKDIKNKLSDYLKKAEREDIIITKNGRPMAGVTRWDLRQGAGFSQIGHSLQE